MSHDVTPIDPRLMTLLGPLGYSAPTDEGPSPWPVASWSWVYIELADAWRVAQGAATAAYEEWRGSPGPVWFAVYRATQDQADKAQDELAAHWANASPQ
jgi:hypothetical protein